MWNSKCCFTVSVPVGPVLWQQPIHGSCLTPTSPSVHSKWTVISWQFTSVSKNSLLLTWTFIHCTHQVISYPDSNLSWDNRNFPILLMIFEGHNWPLPASYWSQIIVLPTLSIWVYKNKCFSIIQITKIAEKIGHFNLKYEWIRIYLHKLFIMSKSRKTFSPSISSGPL